MNSRQLREFDSWRYAYRGDTERAAADQSRDYARGRRDSTLAIVGSVVAHLLLLFLLRDDILPPTPLEDGAAGPAMGDSRPAGGGSGLTMLDITYFTPPPPVVETPVPEPVPDPVTPPEPEEVFVVPEQVAVPSVSPELASNGASSAPGVGGPGLGGLGGTSSGPGTGSGDGLGGGGTGDGGPSAIIPPTPRGIFIPPAGRPDSARGQEITVWVFVSPAGRVDRGTVRLEPPTSDSRYNSRLIESVAEWVFDPARQDGRAVSVWYPFQIIL